MVGKVFIANFGQQNYEWPVCLERGTIATMNAVETQPFWESGDREGYIQNRMLEKTVAGKQATRAVASRWYNLMTEIVDSAGDIWIHSDGEFLWWTTSTSMPPSFERKTEPVGRKRNVIVCHKPCETWSNKNKLGHPLLWRNLHPKAKDFLSTEATHQTVRHDNADYAKALINGNDLDLWHDQKIWRDKNEAASKQYSKLTYANKRQLRRAEVIYDLVEKAKANIAASAKKTVKYSNGQKIETTVKNKNLEFVNEDAFKKYIDALLEAQEGVCAISGLPFDYDLKFGDNNYYPSLDRIDSSGHYAEGNLQIVCRFINFWKGASDDIEFRSLIDDLRNA